jgi:hypothetical protein
MSMIYVSLRLGKHKSYLFCNLADENRILVAVLIRLDMQCLDHVLDTRPKVAFLVQERVGGKCGHRASIRVHKTYREQDDESDNSNVALKGRRAKVVKR